MKKVITSILVSSVLFFNACGVSEDDKAKIEAAAKADLIQQLKDKETLQKSLKAKEKELAETKSNLIETKALLETEKDRMNRIKEFQFGRTANERDQQIMDQSVLIQKLEENVTVLQGNIPVLEGEVNDLKVQLTK